MGAMASQITSITIVYSTFYSGADQSKHQSSASLAFVWGIHRGPVNSPHKWPVTQYDDKWWRISTNQTIRIFEMSFIQCNFMMSHQLEISFVLDNGFTAIRW